MMNSLEISIPLELLEKSLIVLGKLLYQIRDYSASTYLASSAVRFLLKYYNKSKENTEKFFSTFIASLHLSSKVTEFAIPIRKFVEEISKINENKKYEPYLEMIGAKDVCVWMLLFQHHFPLSAGEDGGDVCVTST